MKTQPKSINALMKYMREQKNIEISGSVQKRNLRNMGYFHGYKGYRFCKRPERKFEYTNFDELQAIYDFDMDIKATVYSPLMSLETALKNYVLEIFIEQSKSESFAEIFNNILDDYKHKKGTKAYSSEIKKRLMVRNKVYNEITKNYGRNFIVSHYYKKDEVIPIWAIFELLTLGEFGNLLHCANQKARKEIEKSLGIDISKDSDYRFIERCVFLIKDLRNAVAHNNIIFDTRFKGNNKIAKKVMQYLQYETSIDYISFNTIVDYVILLSFLMKKCGFNKTTILRFIGDYEERCEQLRKQIPITIYSKFIYTDTNVKLEKIKTFVS